MTAAAAQARPAAFPPDEARPFLPRGVRVRRCDVREAWFLLAPERAVKLDPTGSAVLSRVDGVRSVGVIVDELAETYNAPRETIAADARRFLAALIDRRMVELA